MVNKIYDMSGNRVNSTPPVYNLRICLIGSDDLDIKNIETFGVAEDGFFMVKSKSNPRFPIFMCFQLLKQKQMFYKNLL